MELPIWVRGHFEILNFESLMKLHVSWHVLDTCTATWHVWDPSRSTQHPQKPLFWHLGHICSSNGSKVRAWPVFDKFHVYDTCAACEQPRDRCVTYVDHSKILLKHLTCLCTWLYGHCMGVALNAIPLLKCSNLDPYWERVKELADKNDGHIFSFFSKIKMTVPYLCYPHHLVSICSSVM